MSTDHAPCKKPSCGLAPSTQVSHHWALRGAEHLRHHVSAGVVFKAIRVFTGAKIWQSRALSVGVVEKDFGEPLCLRFSQKRSGGGGGGGSRWLGCAPTATCCETKLFKLPLKLAHQAKIYNAPALCQCHHHTSAQELPPEIDIASRTKPQGSKHKSQNTETPQLLSLTGVTVPPLP